jgi:L-ribulose-5-phosphate 4-epimerase
MSPSDAPAPTAGEVKQQLLETAQAMLTSGLVQGTAGNVAARLPDGNVVLTPSSLDYLQMNVDDLVVCTLDGDVVEGHRGPTTEKALHLSALRRYPEINATMHCHAKHCTMFALTRQPIPAVIEEFVVYVGGDVPVANYETTGTDELAEEVAGWVGDRSAVLMANHGPFTIGKDAKDAVKAAVMCEDVARTVHIARQGGELVPIPQEAIDSLFDRYQNVYGQPKKEQ